MVVVPPTIAKIAEMMKRATAIAINTLRDGCVGTNRPPAIAANPSAMKSA
jgi:hypothetical protein